MRVSQGKAYIEGRDFVVPDDIKSLFESVMSHRIILKPESKLKGITEKEVIERAIQRVEVPIV
jgi:MoxR-like ATPase